LWQTGSPPAGKEGVQGKSKSQKGKNTREKVKNGGLFWLKMELRGGRLAVD
jgi:hypothetical protein